MAAVYRLSLCQGRSLGFLLAQDVPSAPLMLLNDVLLHAYSIGRVRNLAVLRKVGGLHMKQGGTGWDLEGFRFMVQNCPVQVLRTAACRQSR